MHGGVQQRGRGGRKGGINQPGFLNVLLPCSLFGGRRKEEKNHFWFERTWSKSEEGCVVFLAVFMLRNFRNHACAFFVLIIFFVPNDTSMLHTV